LFDKGECCFDVGDAFSVWQNRSRFLCFVVYEKDSIIFGR
jgi:hypothetical protein